MRSFFGTGDAIEFVVDVEQALNKSSEFATSLVIFRLETKHLEKMTGGGDGVANGGQIGAQRGCGWGERKLGYEVQLRRVQAGAVKFALQVLLSDLYITQGHADVFVSQQLHESGQADAEAEHHSCEGVIMPNSA